MTLSDFLLTAVPLTESSDSLGKKRRPVRMLRDIAAAQMRKVLVNPRHTMALPERVSEIR